MNAPSWVVYVLISARGATYVGITIDVERRLDQHNGTKPGGAKRTRAGRPWRMGTTYGPYENRSEAMKVERTVKKLRGRRRLSWVTAG